MSLDPNKTYLVWNGTAFPNSTIAQFKAPAGSTIDWGDGTVETFDTASTTVNTHTYTDGKTEHTIAISGLTSLGYRAFRECSNLTSVTIGNSVTSIGNWAFYNCSSLTSITIPESVTSIGTHAVLGCSSLTRVTIPNSVTSIGWDTFRECSNLTSVTIGNSVTSIDGEAFYNCSSLTSITIPESVTSIGYHAFANCNKLTQLILFPSSPPNLGSDAIPSTISKIYVQQSSKAAYQAATNWTAFASKIVSDNIYLSFVRFNQKNKEYINEKISESTPSSSVNVVQTTGNSETDVMSQKAVTDIVQTTFDSEGHPQNAIISSVFKNNPTGFRRLLGINTKNELSILSIAAENAAIEPTRIPYYRLPGNPYNLLEPTATIPVCTPTDAYDATNKQYVDYKTNNDTDRIKCGDLYVAGEAGLLQAKRIQNPNGSLPVYVNRLVTEVSLDANNSGVTTKYLYRKDGGGMVYTLEVPAEGNGVLFFRPNGLPTETSLVTVSSTGIHAYKKVSDFFSESGLIKYESVTIPWANVVTNGFTDTVRVVNQGINEHSLYIRLTYSDWQAEVFLTVISTESNSVTSLDTLLGDTYYHEASGTIHKVADESNYYLGQIQNVSHNGVKVLIPVIAL